MALRALWALLVVATALLGPQVVYAQGFFQFFFGPEPPPRPRWDPPHASVSPQERPETFRTLCVRTCDGYYFPISFSTVRSEFARDADRCTASCGSEARLFYHPNPGGKVEDMVDQIGVGYASLPNAFRFRESLVSDCACRPQPWSEAELERHRAYARTEYPVDGRKGRARSGTATSDGPGRARRNGYGSGIPFSPKRGSPAGL
jgi:hypothetical protein